MWLIVGVAAVILAPGSGGALAAAGGGMQAGRDAHVVGTSIYAENQNVAVIESRVNGAVQMRFGNTRGELALAAWEPYTNRRVWYLPGFNYKTQPVVHAQYRGPQLRLVELQLPVYPAERDQVPDGLTFPYIRIPDARSSDVVVVHSFDTWNERWVTYQDAYGYGNVFFPMTYQARGGVGDGGFVWTDPSRWLVDAPETPQSVLVALNYWRWMFPDEWRSQTGSGDTVDLSNAVLEVALRGRELDLRKADVTFWVLCGGARWHLSQPLRIQNGRWVTNRVTLPVQAGAWDQSWSRGGEPAAMCLGSVESYGLAFRGFERGKAPTGTFDMDEFRLTRPPPAS